MRILFAITKGEIGGAQEHLLMEATGLLARGHEVVALVTQPSALADRLGQLGVALQSWDNIVRDVHVGRDLAARRELRAAVRRVRPDVLHLHSAKAGVLGRRLLTKPDGVTVYTVHHAPFGPGREWTHRVVARPIEQLTLRYVDGIISDGARDLPMIRKLAPRVPVRLVRNAVIHASEPLSPDPPSRTALWVARMRRPKDPLQAVAAWERVVRTYPDARLVMCGTGPLGDALERRIRRCRARDTIDYVGHAPDLREYFRTSSVFLLATDVEGGNTMATLEAMGHGLVPVLNDAGDAFLIEHARAGLVVPRRSPRAMGDAIVTLFDRPERLQEMRPRAIDFARNSWTPDDHVDSIVGFYRELLRA